MLYGKQKDNKAVTRPTKALVRFGYGLMGIVCFAIVSSVTPLISATQSQAKTVVSAKAHLNRATYDHKGWAQATTGGQGGRIIRVTNLNNEGPGSLREAVEATGPRIVVFEVGGVIDLDSKALSIRNGDLTIAGQTAPSPGITLIKGEANIRNAANVIIQHMMFRPGSAGYAVKSGKSMDALSTVGSHNIIVDHCSFSWGSDENMSASGKRFTGNSLDEWRKGTSYNVTYSNNLVYESLRTSTHEKGEHSKGGLFHDNATGILLYGNLYASNVERNALFKGGVQAAQINNMIYNPGLKAVHYNLIGHEWEGRAPITGIITLVGNVYRAGPNTRKGLPLFMLGGEGDVSLYNRDNIAVDEDGKALPQTGRYTTGKARILSAKTAYMPAGLKVLAASEIENEIYYSAGARPWDRDQVDLKLLSDVAEGRGEVIDHESQNYIGYPNYKPTAKPFNEADWDLKTMAPKSGWESLFKGVVSKLS